LACPIWPILASRRYVWRLPTLPEPVKRH